METRISSLLNIFRRYKWATVLNIVGLSLAFTAFYIIGRQSWYEFSFNRSLPAHERIYRLEQYENNHYANPQFPSPILSQIFRSSPHIQAGGIRHTGKSKIALFVPEQPDITYTTTNIKIDSGYTSVFGFEWVSGNISNFEISENNVIIPSSLAKKLYGTIDAAGREIVWKNSNETWNRCELIAVYKDFPENSSVSNALYSYIGSARNTIQVGGNDLHIDEWGNSSFFGYIKIDAPENASRIPRTIPQPAKDKKRFYNSENRTIELLPVDDLYFSNREKEIEKSGDRSMTCLLLGIGILIVGIAGINFSNFSMALAPTRMKSINTQKILGASVISLRISYLSEGMIISFIAFLFSLVQIQLLANSELSRLFLTNISLHEGIGTAAFCGMLSLIVGFSAGLWASIYVTSVPPALALKGAYRLPSRGIKIRNLLIGFQFIVAFFTLILVLFFHLQNRYMLSTPLGFDPTRVVSITFENYENIRNRLAVSGLEEQLKNYAGTQCIFHSDYLLPNKDNQFPIYNDGQRSVMTLEVDPDFIRGLNIEISTGKEIFEQTDPSRNICLINQSARAQTDLEINDSFLNHTVIGYIPDLKIFSFHRTSDTPFALLINGQNRGNIYLKLKSGIDEKAALTYCRNVVTPLSVYHEDIQVKMLTDVIKELYEKDRNQLYTLSLFCGLSICIAVMGVFGLMLFELQSRRKEIGIRKINGASMYSIWLLFNKTYIRILTVCFLLTVPIAGYSVRIWLERFTYRIPLYVWVFAVAFLILSVITIVIVSLQCRYSANENPIKSLNMSE